MFSLDLFINTFSTALVVQHEVIEQWIRRNHYIY